MGEGEGERSWSSVAVSISSPTAGGGIASVVTVERLRVGGVGRLSQSLCTAVWSPPQLTQRVGGEELQPGAALRLPPPGQVGLGHRWEARVWLREQMGQTGSVDGDLGATWPNLQQFSHCVYLLEEEAILIVGEREKSLMEEPIVWTSTGWTETMTEVAVLPSLE